MKTAQDEIRGTIVAYLELAKARLCGLVLVTTVVGFMLGSRDGIDGLRLVCALGGTMLTAFGANALNQCVEAGRDALMRRTSGRPLPSGRVGLRDAYVFAMATAITGPALLAAFVNPLTAVLALAAELVYVLLYTPLKVRSPLNTLVGAVCGAIPPMIGWTAAAGELGLGAWVLGAILFLWQIPHFLALAWMYRDDYRRGGFRMLPAFDASGRLTCQVIILYSLSLVPLTLLATLGGMTGLVYAVGALLLGCGLSLPGVRLYRDRSIANARRVFLASVIYLPLLLGLMVLDRTSTGETPPTGQSAPTARLMAADAQGRTLWSERR